MKAGFFKQLCEIAGKENVRTDEPMKQHTTFRIGGAADYFVSPQTTDQIKNIIELCKSEAMPWYVIGNGSNLLVSDRGFRGGRQAVCAGWHTAFQDSEKGTGSIPDRI